MTPKAPHPDDVADLAGEGSGSCALSEIGTLSRSALRAAEIVDRMPSPLAAKVVDMLAQVARTIGDERAVHLAAAAE